MRWIRLTTAAIARAFGLRAAMLYTDAIFLLNKTMEQLVGLPSELLNSLDEPGVISLLTNEGDLDTDRLTLLADLVKEQADVYADQHLVQESTWRYQRSLNFYLESLRNGGPTRVDLPLNKILTLWRVLEDQVPPETLFELFTYFGTAGRYDEADQSLTRLINQVGKQDDLLQAARTFYQGLLEKSDRELAGGGLTRMDVESRLRSLGVA